MKRSGTLLLYSLCCTLCAYGQQVVLSTPATSALYIGFHNKVTIAVPGYPCEDLEVTTLHYQQLQGAGCTYLVVPGSGRPVDFMIRARSSGQVLDTVTLPAVEAPVRIKITESDGNTGPLLKDGPVMTSDDHGFLNKTFHFADSFKIARFNVTFVSNDSIVYEHRITGDRYDASALAVIATAQPGDILIIDEVLITRPDKVDIASRSVVYKFQ